MDNQQSTASNQSSIANNTSVPLGSSPQPTTHNQQPTTSPSSSSPSPASPPSANTQPPTSNQDAAIAQAQQPAINNQPYGNVAGKQLTAPLFSHLALPSFIILLTTSFLLSFFYFSRPEQRQPKTQTSARENLQPATPFLPKNSGGFNLVTSPITAISNLSSPTPQPTQTSGTFANIIQTTPTPAFLQCLAVSPEETAPTREATNKSPTVTLELAGDADVFSPKQLTARINQIVTINISAKDHVYDFFLPDFGLYLTIPQDEKKSVQFQASSLGRFVFYCKDHCTNPQMTCGFLTIQL